MQKNCAFVLQLKRSPNLSFIFKNDYFIVAVLTSSLSASAFDIKDLIGKYMSDSDSSSVTDVFSGILGDVLSTNKLTVQQLEGTWSYSAPAVTFISDDLLEKAGGAAAAETIEGKLETIYKLVKLNQLTFTVDSQSNFTIGVGKIKLSGTIEANTAENATANFILKFKSLGKSSMDVNAYITKSIDSSMTLTFDITKLISIMQEVSKIAKSSSVTTIVNALASFDGICAGFELKK